MAMLSLFEELLHILFFFFADGENTMTALNLE